MAAPVWILSVDLQAKTATFQSGMSEAAKSARGSFNEIKSGSSEMGGHVNTNMFAARHSVMALSEAFGGQMPRAITAFIAHIGPLGAALEAAFPFAAIGLGAVLLIEHLAKLQAAGHELTEDQVKFGTAAQNAFNAMDMKILQSGIRADELRNDHLGALHLQLELIDKQSMAELAGEFEKLAHAADETFLHLKTSWYQFGEGSAGAKRSLEDFQDQYEHLLSTGDAKGASDLLASKLARESEILKMQKAASAQTKGDKSSVGAEFNAEVEKEQAVVALRKMKIDYGDKEVASQQRLVDILNDQVKMEGKAAELKKSDSTNATASTGKEMSALQAVGAKQAAEHAQKMGELSIAAEREQAQVSLDIKQASIAERLAMDIHLADEEYNVQLESNKRLQDALNKGGADYANQLKALQEKAEELTAQHGNTIAALQGHATEEQYRQDLADLEASERDKIEATMQGSSARLAAIDAALKEEEAKGLQETAFYHDLAKQRVQVEREASEQAAKLAAEAGKEASDNILKMGELALAADRAQTALRDSGRRTSIQQQLAEELDAANQEYALKLAAFARENAALDQGAKDYQNKLKAIYDKERELTQEHENQITAIKDKAMMDQNTKQQGAMTQLEEMTAAGLTQVLMGHKSFASMMDGIGNEVVSGMMKTALMSMMTMDMDKEKQAASAARTMFLSGAKLPFPANIVAAPVMGAAAFASMMAFADGGIVPGVGSGDTVPAMLTPGEGVVPGGVMDGLRKMASSGGMSGGTHYHAPIHYAPVINAVDGDGVEKMLDNHGDKFQKHVETTLRKLNR